VEVDPEGAVRVPAGTALDLGATGKAYAADLVASHVARTHGVSCVVSIGGDVAVGRPDAGRGPAPPRAQSWPVRVCETPDDDAGETVVLTDGGLATSTTLRRRWTRDGVTLHHLLDPRTGRPVERRWRTASVAAATCVEANTASTAAVILGDEAPAWLRERALPARLVDRDGEVVHCCGWPEEEQGAGRWSSS
jgi:thiamine biosynthesis lipoprotein